MEKMAEEYGKTSVQKKYLEKKYNEIKLPVEYESYSSWDTMIMYVETYSIILAIIVGFICAGIFADDFELKFYYIGSSRKDWKNSGEIIGIKISYWGDDKFHLIKKFPIYCCFIKFYEPYPDSAGIAEYEFKNRVDQNKAIRGYLRDFIIEDMEFILFYNNGDTSKDKFWYWKGLEFD